MSSNYICDNHPTPSSYCPRWRYVVRQMYNDINDNTLIHQFREQVREDTQEIACNPPEKENTTVIRIITYEGPKEWVNRTLESSMPEGTTIISENPLRLIRVYTPLEEDYSDLFALAKQFGKELGKIPPYVHRPKTPLNSFNLIDRETP